MRSGAQFSHESMMSHVCYKQVRGAGAARVLSTESPRCASTPSGSRDHGELMSRGRAYG